MKHKLARCLRPQHKAKLPDMLLDRSVASQFDRRLFRSKVVSIEDKSQCDRRVNDYKNYSSASV